MLRCQQARVDPPSLLPHPYIFLGLPGVCVGFTPKPTSLILSLRPRLVLPNADHAYPPGTLKPNLICPGPATQPFPFSPCQGLLACALWWLQ